MGCCWFQFFFNPILWVGSFLVWSWHRDRIDPSLMVMFATPVYLDMFGVGGVWVLAQIIPKLYFFRSRFPLEEQEEGKNRWKTLKTWMWFQSLQALGKKRTWASETLKTFGFQFSNIRHFLIEVQRCWWWTDTWWWKKIHQSWLKC